MEDRVKKILKLLDKKYGINIPCFLNYKKDYELLFATILAAQCTDMRVNEVTKVLFKKYKNLDDYNKAKLDDIEKIIMPCGFYHSKAKSIKESARLLIENFKGKVPSKMDELTSLPGVGRKTANVIRTHIYNIPSIVCDTHVLRTSKLIGLCDGTNPKEVEEQLEKVLPVENWSRINPQLMTLGRTYCKARKRDCANCFLNSLCDFSKNNENKQNKADKHNKVLKKMKSSKKNI